MNYPSIGPLVLLLLVMAAGSASAQWLDVRDPDTPRTADGKPDLSAPAPRTPDGKPDLSGIWHVPYDGPPTYVLDLAADLPPDAVPLRPWAAALLKEREDDFGKDYPPSRCLPPGVPNLTMAPFPFKIIQTPGVTVILHEALATFRQVFTDGRALPVDPNPAWLGYSVGAWEGDAFVVQTAGFHDRTWLDIKGRPNTDALKVTERFRRRDVGHMDIEITIDDAKAYTRPWTVTIPVALMPDTELLEFVCNENNRYEPDAAGG